MASLVSSSVCLTDQQKLFGIAIKLDIHVY